MNLFGTSAVNSPMRSSRRALIGLAAAASALSLVPEVGAEPDAGDDYPLDDLPRRIEPRGPVRCPAVELTTYRGKHMRYAEPAKIFSGFQPRLERFEKVVVALATEMYGRAPRTLVHLGTHNCRRISAYPDWLSEHGIGNAIDVAGFDFGPLPAEATAPEDLPKPFRGPFSVRMLSHWKVKQGVLAIHARFLRTLARRLIARPEIFRVLLGPNYPGHHNHFHFDCAPYRMIDIFEPAEPRPSS
jgi:hypothetical protein